MKKQLFALVLALFALSTAAFAATQNQQNTADALDELGLFLGTDEGYALDRQLQRSDGITLLVRLLGKEAQAKAAAASHPFTDVPEWLAPYVAYAYDAGLTTGVSDTAYGSDAAMSRAQFLTMVLRALGYTDQGEGADFAWDAPFALAKTAGVAADEKADASFSRGEAVEAFWNALGATLKGTQTLLSDELSAAGVFTASELAAAAETQKNGKAEDKYAYENATYVNPRTGNLMTAEQMALELTAFAYNDKRLHTDYDQQNVTKISRANDPMRMIDTRREIYNAPERASEEDRLYFDCSSFVWSNYYEVFGESFEDSADRFVPKTALMCTKGKNAMNAGKVGPEETVVYYRAIGDSERASDALGEQVIREMRSILVPGDVIVYGKSSTPGVYDGGHTLLYLDGGYTIEAVGGDYKYLTAVDSKDLEGGVKLRDVDEYLFNPDSSSCVWNISDIAQIAILRPLNDPALKMTERAIARLELGYLSVSKLCKHPGQSVEQGETLTYTIVLNNDSSSGKSENKTVTVSDPLPTNTAYVSATNGGKLVDGKVVFENVSVAAGKTVELSYTVSVTAASGKIESGIGYVDALSFDYHPITIATRMTESQYAALSAKLDAGKAEGETAFAWVTRLYREVLGKELGAASEKELFDAFFSASSVSGLYKVDCKDAAVVRALVENYSAGYLVLNETHAEQVERVRLIEKTNLQKGDLLVYEKNGVCTYYVFRGENLTKITEDGTATAPLSRTLGSAFGQDRFVILRPSMI